MAESSELGLGADIEPSLHTSNTTQSSNLSDTTTKMSSATIDEDVSFSDNSHPSTSTAIHRASLGSETEGLVLFDLTTKPGAKVAFSPHCMKTILDLKLLDIGYDRQRLTFTEVRTKLSQRVADNVTVPTLELSNGSHISDSWSIAQYLYTSHPKGELLFPSKNTSRSFARMVEGFGKFALAPNLGPITRVEIYHHLDKDSKEYFEMQKIGKKKMDQFRSLSKEEKVSYAELCALALEPIQAALIVAKENSPTSQVWLEGGSHPTHADFVLFGWQCYSRIAGRVLTKHIWNTHPAVSKWVQDMNDWAGPEITKDFF